MGPSLPLVFLDAAIPMYAVGQAHPYQIPCQWVMAEIARGHFQAAIDTEVIQEVLHRYGALRRYAEAVRVAQELLSTFSRIFSITTADMQTAVVLFSQ